MDQKAQPTGKVIQTIFSIEKLQFEVWQYDYGNNTQACLLTQSVEEIGERLTEMVVNQLKDINKNVS